MRSLIVFGNQQAGVSASASVLRIDGAEVRAALLTSRPPRFDPAAPAHSGCVLMRVKALSCNYRDKGLIQVALERGVANSFYTIGSEFVGEILAVGEHVQGFAPGDRVVADNFYDCLDPQWGDKPQGVPTNHGSREYQIIRYEKVVKIPPNMPDAVAGAFSLGAQTAYSMVRRLEIRPGSNVLITASRSNTALFVINALKSYDVTIYALTSSKGLGARLRALGVDAVLPCTHGPCGPELDPAVGEVYRATGGFDYVIDPFFNVFLPVLTPLMRFGGKYITCGGSSMHSEHPQPNILEQIMGASIIKNLQFMGNCLGTRRDLANALADYAAGAYDIVLDSAFEGQRVGPFLERTFNSKERFGKVVYVYN